MHSRNGEPERKAWRVIYNIRNVRHGEQNVWDGGLYTTLAMYEMVEPEI